jgi:heptosyltransferase I
LKLPLTSAPDSICIVRLSALGDVTHAVPVVRAIQQQWPETQITWICATLEHKLLAALDGINFIAVDKKSGWRGYYRLWRTLAGQRFDIMLQMQTSARANFTGAVVKADIKLGWDRLRARDFHRFFMTHSIPQTRFEHQLQGHLSFARSIGLEAAEPEWNFPVSDDAIAFVDALIPADKRVLLISPCSSHVHRNWRAERYAAIADHAIEDHGMTVVLSGGPSAQEASVGQAIESAARSSPRSSLINLIGKDTLPQLVALLQRADVVLSPDSGPVHLANALGTPVIGLHACTWSKRSGPYNSLDLCVDKFGEAAQQYRDTTPELLRWGTRIEEDGVMDLVEVAEVRDRLELALQRL